MLNVGRRTTNLLAPLLGAVLCSLGGCPLDGGDMTPNNNQNTNSSTPDPIVTAPMSTRQQPLTQAAFEAELAADAALAALLDQARRDDDADDWLAAGEFGGQDGTSLLWAAYGGPGADPIVLLRHCKGNDCIEAYQVVLNAERDEIVWVTAAGEIEPREVPVPFLLRIINESNPDEDWSLAPLPNALRASPRVVEMAEDAAKTPLPRLAPSADITCRFSVASAFGRWFSAESFDWNQVAQDAQNADYDERSVTYHANQSEVDALLRNRGPQDTVVIFAHGDVSQSRGRAVGFSVARHLFRSEHYSETRVRAQLDANIQGGPGILFLANCQSADMLPQLDNPENPDRIIIGVTASDFTGAIFRMTKVFFQNFAAGKTVRESLEAANRLGFTGRLVANRSANLDRRLGDTFDACPANGACMLPDDPIALLGFRAFRVTNYAAEGGYIRVLREDAEKNPPLLSSFPGGGISKELRAEITPITDVFPTVEAVVDSLCARVSGYYRPPLATFILKANFDGQDVGIDGIFQSRCPD